MNKNMLMNGSGDDGFNHWQIYPEYDILDTFRKGEYLLSNVRNEFNYEKSQGFLIEDEPAGSKVFPSE